MLEAADSVGRYWACTSLGALTNSVWRSEESPVIYAYFGVLVQVQHAQAVAASMTTDRSAMPSVEDAFQQLDMDNYDNELSDVVSRLLQVRCDAACVLSTSRCSCNDYACVCSSTSVSSPLGPSWQKSA